MSLECCKECGDEIGDSKAEACSNCGSLLTEKPDTAQEKTGCLGFLLIIIVLLVFMGKFLISLEERSRQKEELETQDKTVQIWDEQVSATKITVEEQKKPKEVFFDSIEEHYRRLVALYNGHNLEGASRELDLFIKHNKLDYKDVMDIKKKTEVAQLERKVKAIPVSHVSENLRLYGQLMRLDPDNPTYEKKVAFYKARLERKAPKRKKKLEFVLIGEKTSAPVFSYPPNGSVLGNIPAGKKVQIFERQLVKRGKLNETWYRVKFEGNYGWISQDVTVGKVTSEFVR